MKALIVDDCPLTREMIGLAMKGIAEVGFAENGVQAVDLVQQAIDQGEHYDLICLDISMPVMGGQESLRGIRSLEAECGCAKSIVFMVTASSSPEDMIEAITMGECDDYLTKPVIRNNLMTMLRNHGLID